MICCCNTNCLSKEYCERFTKGLDKDDEDLVNFGQGKNIYGCEYLEVVDSYQHLDKHLQAKIAKTFTSKLDTKLENEIS